MVDPNPITGVLRKRRKFRNGHPGKMSREDKGRDWSDVSTSQTAPRVSDHHLKLGQAWNRFSSQPTDILVQNSSFQNCERMNLCCSNPGKLWETNTFPHTPTFLPIPPLVLSDWTICLSILHLLDYVPLTFKKIHSNTIFSCIMPPPMPLTPRWGLPDKYFSDPYA